MRFSHPLPSSPSPSCAHAGKQAPLESRSNTGDTPLTLAAYFGHVHAVERLLAMGANATAMDDDGHAAGEQSAFLVACSCHTVHVTIPRAPGEPQQCCSSMPVVIDSNPSVGNRRPYERRTRATRRPLPRPATAWVLACPSDSAHPPRPSRLHAHTLPGITTSEDALRRSKQTGDRLRGESRMMRVQGLPTLTQPYHPEPKRNSHSILLASVLFRTKRCVYALYTRNNPSGQRCFFVSSLSCSVRRSPKRNSCALLALRISSSWYPSF